MDTMNCVLVTGKFNFLCQNYILNIHHLFPCIQGVIVNLNIIRVQATFCSNKKCLKCFTYYALVINSDVEASGCNWTLEINVHVTSDK